jgi:CRISPR-associated endonuclease/helicase Cas3
VWILAGDASEVRVTNLTDLIEEGTESLESATVLLPPKAGGLAFSRQGSCFGLLDGNAAFEEAHEDAYDVADQWLNEAREPRRRRTWNAARPPGMRLVRTINVPADADVEDDEDEAPHTSWRWYVRPRSADDDGSRTAREPQLLADHLGLAEHYAGRLAESLALNDLAAAAVVMAARWHDLGKHRRIWQMSVLNTDYPLRVLAKSAGSMVPLYLTGYRHEFGSMLDIATLGEFMNAPTNVQELVLHLVAHHGRARPHFAADEAFDPERTDELAQAMAQEVPRRFARLQRKYGRWGLELSWRKGGFWPGNDLADRYGVPDHLKRFPRFHVKIHWRDAVGAPVDIPGPVCLGGGRFFGIGLCASL